MKPKLKMAVVFFEVMYNKMIDAAMQTFQDNSRKRESSKSDDKKKSFVQKHFNVSDER
jgi:hypothetical protein